MNTRLALLVLAAMMASSGSASPSTSADTKVGQEMSYDDCIKASAAYLSSIQIDDVVRAQVKEAAKYYDSMPDDYDFEPVEVPESCIQFQEKVFNLPKAVDCNFNKRVMGGPESSQVLVELINASEGAKRVIEASFACSSGSVPPFILRTFYPGVLEAIRS